MHETSFKKMEGFVKDYLSEYKDREFLIIDLGSQSISGMKTYKGIFNGFERWVYKGVDIAAGENVDIVLSDPYRWVKIEDESIDVLITGQTLEHIEYPWLTMLEIARVLKPGGVACIIAPSSGPEHKYPVDCWRIYPDGMRALAKYSGLEVIEVFTDWGLGEWQDIFTVLQKPHSVGTKDAPFKRLENKNVAENVYLEAFSSRPQLPYYYFRASEILKKRGDVNNAFIYLLTGVNIFPHNIFLRQKLIETTLIIGNPFLALDHALFLLKSRPFTAENIKVIDKVLAESNESMKKAILEQLPQDINSLKNLANICENTKSYKLGIECWKTIVEKNPNDYNAICMLGLFYRGAGDLIKFRETFKKTLSFQFEKNILNRTTIIQRLIEKHGYQTYIEIGAERGINFFQIEAPLKIGVDPSDKMILGGLEDNANEKFFIMTSDEFFLNPPEEILTKGIDIAFIDGLHTYKQSLKDVENVLKYLNPDGVIVMHDCLPDSESAAALSLEEAKKHPDFRGFWTGDVYKTIIHLRSTRDDLFVFVIDTDWGVGIIKKGKLESMLSLSLEEIKKMGYRTLIRHIEYYLNLKTKDWFLSWLEAE